MTYERACALVDGAWLPACEATGRFVYKFDSPNNQCSHVGIECDYEEEDDD